jgi:hypothetical protein
VLNGSAADIKSEQLYYGEPYYQALFRAENSIIAEQVRYKPVILKMMTSAKREERSASLRAARLVFDRDYMKQAVQMLDDNDPSVRQSAVKYFLPMHKTGAHFRNFDKQLRQEILSLLASHVSKTTDYSMVLTLLDVLESYNDAMVRFSLKNVQENFSSFSKRLVNVQKSRPITAAESRHLKDFVDDVIHKSGKIH